MLSILNNYINNRYQASLLHLTISLLVLSFVISLIILWWYPGIYFELEGANNALTILFCVDATLGPFLTLLIYKKGKPGLKFDITVIVCIQLSAMIYGCSIIYTERPVFNVFAVDRFTLVSNNDIDTSVLLNSDLHNGHSRGPVLIFAAMPENLDKRNSLLFGAFEGKSDLEFRAEYYEPFLPNLDKVISRSRDINKYINSDLNGQKVKSFLESNKFESDKMLFFPIIGKNKDMLLALHKDTGDILGAIDIDPWLKN